MAHTVATVNTNITKYKYRIAAIDRKCYIALQWSFCTLDISIKSRSLAATDHSTPSNDGWKIGTKM